MILGLVAGIISAVASVVQVSQNKRRTRCWQAAAQHHDQSLTIKSPHIQDSGASYTTGNCECLSGNIIYWLRMLDEQNWWNVIDCSPSLFAIGNSECPFGEIMWIYQLPSENARGAKSKQHLPCAQLCYW